MAHAHSSSHGTAVVDRRPARARFESLYREHAAFVWAAARQCGAPPAVVDDVVQDVFVSAYRRFDEVRWEVSPRGWLYGVTRRVAFRYRRSAARAARRVAAVAATKAERGEGTPHAESAHDLETLLRGLSRAQRRLVVMSELLGMSGPEIAAELEIPVNTAYSRIRTVRAQLRARARSSEALERTLAQSRAEDRPSRAQVARGWVALAPLLRPAWVPVATPVMGKALGGLAAIGATIAVTAVLASVVGRGGADEGRAESTRAAGAVAEPGRAEAVRRSAPTVETRAAARSVDEPTAARSANEPTAARSANEPTAAKGSPTPTDRQAPSRSAVTPPGAAPDTAPPSVQRPREMDESAGGIEAELALLERARTALFGGDAQQSLRLVGEHRRRFPDSTMADAREATRARALCRAGRREQARQVAAALRRDHPDSSVAASVANVCP